MKIKIELSNSESGDWEPEREVELIPYDEIFAAKNPNLPVGEMFAGQFSLDDYDIDIGKGVIVSINVHYYEKENSAVLSVKKDGTAFVQAHGAGFDVNGNGLKLIFLAPKALSPTSVTLVR